MFKLNNKVEIITSAFNDDGWGQISNELKADICEKNEFYISKIGAGYKDEYFLRTIVGKYIDDVLYENELRLLQGDWDL